MVSRDPSPTSSNTSRETRCGFGAILRNRSLARKAIDEMGLCRTDAEYTQCALPLIQPMKNSGSRGSSMGKGAR